MDTSEQYMKMVCILPEEFWKDFKDDNLTPQVCSHCRKFVMDRRVACCNRMNRFPAPRQDQLHQMISSVVYSLDHFFMKDSVEIYRCFVAEQIFCGDSFEQVLLQAVMKQKFGKTWNGEEWRK